MDALDELMAFCEKHPEIRAHKKIGELLQDVAAELAALSTELKQAEKDRDKFMEEGLNELRRREKAETEYAQLRAELATLRNAAVPYAVLVNENELLRADLSEADQLIWEALDFVDGKDEILFNHLIAYLYPKGTV
jgi:chromosome segregation ATPase